MALARAGHTVSCCQLAGHCATPEELRRSTWQQWYASVEAAHDRLKEHCDIVVAGGLSMGGILATHLAQNRPEDVHGLLLFSPTLKLDGWSMPWYSRVLNYLRPLPFRFEFDLAEHEPYGLKDERVRALVVSAMQGGDAGLAGVFSTPLRSFANLNALVSVVKRNLGKVCQPALIVHPREDDMASLAQCPLPAKAPRRPGRHAGPRQQLSHGHARSAAPHRGSAGRELRGMACRARFVPGARWQVSPRVS